MVAGGWEGDGGNEEMLVTGYKVSLVQDEEVWGSNAQRGDYS